MKSFFNLLYTITNSQQKLKATLNAVDLAMDVLLSSQVRKFKTTNLHQHHGHR